MLENYFKIAWRNLHRYRTLSIINIGGLATGMAVAILIGLWIHDELTFNNNHDNHDRIVRVMRKGTLNGETHVSPYLPFALAEELQINHKNILKNTVAAWRVNDHIISTEKENIFLKGEFMQPNGVSVFSLPMIEGSATSLSDQHSIILSESTAKILFGDEPALNKTLKIDNMMEAKVTGIYTDLPHNSHFADVQFFAPLELLITVNQWVKYQGFKNNFLDIYGELEYGVSVESASHQVQNVILDHIKDDATYTAVNPQLFLHPMEKWHLWSDWRNGEATGLIRIVWLFGIVGVLVVLLACINFMNLSTARSEKRAKEVGIRKVVGSARIQLIKQFLSESLLIVTLAFVLALAIAGTSLDGFNSLASKQIQMPFTNINFWLICIAFIAITGVMAGSYPAFYLSSFKSVRVLKGALHPGRFASLPRKILVVVQFAVSTILIIGTTTVYKQIQFAKDRATGYDRENLVMIQKTSPEFNGKHDVLRAEMLATGVVQEMGQCSSPVTDIWNSNGGFEWIGKDPAFIAELATFTVTPEYGETVGWKFLRGRDLSAVLASDSSAFVINEAAAKMFGFKDPIGQVVKWQSWWTNGVREFTIIGVIKDQISGSPYAPPVPSAFFLGGQTSWIVLRLQPGLNTRESLAKMKAVFHKILPNVPFDYKFVDEEYAAKFSAEERIGQLALVFSILAIFISCLGLFGLVSFVAEQRSKEIGIRKIVGASTLHLWAMLSKDFLRLVFISCLIAIPAAYYFLSDWLIQFQYRTELSWWIFVAASATAILITLMTVSYQSIRAAIANPVKSLRNE